MRLSMNPHDYKKLLESGFWFDELSEELKKSLLDAGVIKHYRQGALLFSRGDEFNGLYAVRTWSTPTTGYATFNGMNIPAGGVGVWQLPDGDLSYVNVRLTGIAYNQPIADF